MDPSQTMNQNLFNDAQFFGDASYNMSGFPNTGFTPYMNGPTLDMNVFENEYSMHGQLNNNYMTPFDMSMNGMSQSDMDGMTFNPTTMMLGAKHREYSTTSSESNQASASPQARPLRSLPMSSHSSDSTGAASSPVDAQDESVNSAKRNRFLERNRLAAAKCRTKKKEWTNNLEAAARQASQQTRELHAIVQNLRNEVQEHKALLMSHQGCDCHPIHEYLMHHGHEHNNTQ